MSAKIMILTAALLGLGFSVQNVSASDPAPRGKGQAFDRMDQNHDGVIQREEFDKVMREREDRPRRGRGEGFGGGGRPGGAEALKQRIDEAVDRALERSAGDPQKLRDALQEELVQSFRHGRAPQRGDRAKASPESDGADGQKAPPADGARGAGARRGAPGEFGAFGGRHGRGAGPRDGAIFRNVDPQQRAERILNRIDKNHDGFLTADELGDRGERLMKADANKDGRIDATELREFFQHIKEERDPAKGDPPKAPPAPPEK